MIVRHEIRGAAASPFFGGRLNQGVMRVEEARALVVTLVRVAVTITVLAPAFGVGLVAFIAARA